MGRDILFTAFGVALGGMVAFWGGYVYGRHVEEKEWRQLQREGVIKWRPMLVPPPQEFPGAAGLGCKCR